MSQTLPSLLFSALFTLPQGFGNYPWPKSAGEVKDCLSLPVPRPGSLWGVMSVSKSLLGKCTELMLDSLSKSLNLCGLLERDQLNLEQ